MNPRVEDGTVWITDTSVEKNELNLKVLKLTIRQKEWDHHMNHDIQNTGVVTLLPTDEASPEPTVLTYELPALHDRGKWLFTARRVSDHVLEISAHWL